MKNKNLLKKLSLNKQTIANINDDELKEVKGGSLPPLPTTSMGNKTEWGSTKFEEY